MAGQIRHGILLDILPILASTVTAASACAQTIDFMWTSEGFFHGTPAAGTVDTMFSSSAPFNNLTDSHATYTGSGGAMRTFGPFEITAAGGDTLLGDFDTLFTGPVRLGRNVGTGTFTFTGGTGQFAGASGQGDMDVAITLDRFPTSTGAVEQVWRGSITLAALPLPGDYNQNGTVEQADLDLILLNWGADALALSFNWASGTVDQDELDGVLLHWGDMAAVLGLATAGVPEPSTALTCAASLWMIWAAHRAQAKRRTKEDRTFISS
jgi:hypothetical protein